MFFGFVEGHIHRVLELSSWNSKMEKEIFISSLGMDCFPCTIRVLIQVLSVLVLLKLHTVLPDISSTLDSMSVFEAFLLKVVKSEKFSKDDPEFGVRILMIERVVTISVYANYLSNESSDAEVITYRFSQRRMFST